VDLREPVALFPFDIQQFVVYFSTASGFFDQAMLLVAGEIEEPCG
jgi:hypothetical protein